MDITFSKFLFYGLCIFLLIILVRYLSCNAEPLVIGEKKPDTSLADFNRLGRQEQGYSIKAGSFVGELDLYNLMNK